MNKILVEDFEYIIGKNEDIKLIEGKTILISGVNGFIPAYIAEFILYLNQKYFNKKTKIIGIARSKEKCEKKFKKYLDREELKFIYQDIKEEIKILDEVDYILHCASQASPKYYMVDPIGTIDANVLGTRNLLEFSKGKKIKSFLFFSSVEVYGKIENKYFPVKETYLGRRDLQDIRSCYSESKSMGEVYCQSYYHQCDIPIKILRIFHTYGPGLQRGDGRVFMDFIENILDEKDIIMKSDGTAKRTFCYIADAVDAYFRVLLKGINGEVYNVGNSYQEISIIGLAEKLIGLSTKKIKILKKEREMSDNYIKSDINRNIGDISKIEKLGWKPSIDITTGFSRMIKYMKKELQN